jgi:hypothetical protein
VPSNGHGGRPRDKTDGRAGCDRATWTPVAVRIDDDDACRTPDGSSAAIAHGCATVRTASGRGASPWTACRSGATGICWRSRENWRGEHCEDSQQHRRVLKDIQDFHLAGSVHLNVV